MATFYDREGADVEIRYLPSEQTDADEAITLNNATGQKVVAQPSAMKPTLSLTAKTAS